MLFAATSCSRLPCSKSLWVGKTKPPVERVGGESEYIVRRHGLTGPSGNKNPKQIFLKKKRLRSTSQPGGPSSSRQPTCTSTSVCRPKEHQGNNAMSNKTTIFELVEMRHDKITEGSPGCDLHSHNETEKMKAKRRSYQRTRRLVLAILFPLATAVKSIWYTCGTRAVLGIAPPVFTDRPLPAIVSSSDVLVLPNNANGCKRRVSVVSL
jgi:hypothetical protein